MNKSGYKCVGALSCERVYQGLQFPCLLYEELCSDSEVDINFYVNING